MPTPDAAARIQALIDVHHRECTNAGCCYRVGLADMSQVLLEELDRQQGVIDRVELILHVGGTSPKEETD